MVVGAGVLFLARQGGNGQGVDLFTADLSTAGIDPAPIVESDGTALDQAQPVQAATSQGSAARGDSELGSQYLDDSDVPSALPLVDESSAPDDTVLVVADANDVDTTGAAETERVTSPSEDVPTALSIGDGSNGTAASNGRFTSAAEAEEAVVPAPLAGRNLAGPSPSTNVAVTSNNTATTTPGATTTQQSFTTSPPTTSSSRTAAATTASTVTSSNTSRPPVSPAVTTPSTVAPSSTTPSTATPSTVTPSTVAPTNDTVEAEPVLADLPDGPWCQVEVRATDGVIRWDDEGKTAVFRRNDSWFHTPDTAAQVVLIPETVNTADEYVLRLWGGGGTTDVVCSLVNSGNGVNSGDGNSTVVSQPPTTAAPEVAAVGGLPTPIGIPGGPVQIGFSADVWANDRVEYWNDLEATPGTGTFIAHEFKSFTKEINTDLYRWHLESGRDLLLTWNGTDAETILNGSHDDWIREHARELRSLPGTVMLRFWHEPDVNHKRAWIDSDPQQYIDSWMYVRQIFAEEQALNIEWVWCPTAWNWNEQGARYYPGDANVDWICSDGYSGWDLNAPLTDIADAYTDFQAWADQRPNKPILIAEFGAGQRGPGERAEWVHGIDDWVAASPNIRAVVYFDIDMRPNGEIYDWRLRTEPDAWNAMLDVISSAPFGR